MNENVEFRWTVSSTFDPSVSSVFYIYKGYPDSPTSSDYILAYYGYIDPPYCDTARSGDLTVSCLHNGNIIGFGITNVQDSSASRYTLRIRYGSTPTYELDAEAIMYIYSKFINISLL